MIFNVVCEAIGKHLLLEFDYGGLHRVVQPYCHGISTTGQQSLRAIQIEGGSRSPALRSGKLWTVSKMSNLRLGGPFVPDDPHYNPEDSAFATIHCRI